MTSTAGCDPDRSFNLVSSLTKYESSKAAPIPKVKLSPSARIRKTSSGFVRLCSTISKSQTIGSDLELELSSDAGLHPRVVYTRSERKNVVRRVFDVLRRYRGGNGQQSHAQLDTTSRDRERVYQEQSGTANACVHNGSEPPAAGRSKLSDHHHGQPEKALPRTRKVGRPRRAAPPPTGETPEKYTHEAVYLPLVVRRQGRAEEAFLCARFDAG